MLITLTSDEVQHIDIGADGKVRSTELRTRLAIIPPAPLVDPQAVTMTSRSEGTGRSGLTASLTDYIQAETEAQARAILEEHPELLTDPQVEAAWQQFWTENPTAQPRITTRHKLWKRKRRQHARKEGKAFKTAERAKAKDEADEIHWQPISQLPELAAMVDGIYKDDQDQYALYLEAREKPHVLDDETVKRAVRLYDDRLDLLATLFGPQFVRWQAEPLTDGQRQEVARLIATLADLKALDEKILALLGEIKQGTIDAVMRKSDFELGLEAVYGKVPLTEKQISLAQKIDTWVKGIEKRGGGDVELLKGMYDYMPIFKQIMDTARPDQMDKLCATYPGFYRFAMLLEDLARGIQDGVIDVPK